MSADLELIYDDAVLVMGTARNVLFGGWKDAPTVETLRTMEDAGREYARGHGPLVLFNVAYGGTPSFSEDVRKETTRLTGDPSLFQLSRAHVVQIPGFKGAAVRAFMNTFILLGRPPHPTRMLGSSQAAIDWILPVLERSTAGWTAADLKAESDALAQAASP